MTSHKDPLTPGEAFRLASNAVVDANIAYDYIGNRLDDLTASTITDDDMDLLRSMVNRERKNLSAAIDMLDASVKAWLVKDACDDLDKVNDVSDLGFTDERDHD
ncbi:hypothetical protein [Trueperella bialowiezensis]|uniref:Uncharacterized protein n=1 Tax=Trueperella bialowiezensis TaxID=312285 RepID=A0A448PE86_9ACTO|nr:hypothetical protein [Trueperella bialowiezensis]VEI13242.1 Uncharacterised protein [Trueperella bialowiezensis]